VERRLYDPRRTGRLIGVALGAFAAHGLKARLEPELLATFETGVRYQLYHAFALLAAAWGIHALGRTAGSVSRVARSPAASWCSAAASTCWR
jgi:uncharacterized membrane protein YgdD (TMEM256/DUF423 family)